MKNTIVLGVFFFGFNLFADDTELFVNVLPPTARPNILMIYDASGSMLRNEPSTGQPRRVGAEQAAINFINVAKNINFGLLSFQPIGRSTQLRFDVPVQDINTVRNQAITAIQNYSYRAWTPLYESYYEAYQYFRGSDVTFSTFLASGTTVPGSTPTQYQSPVTHRCQRNIILLITDGLPSVYPAGLNLIRNLISTTSFPTGEGLTGNCDVSNDSSDNEWCVEELGFFIDTAQSFWSTGVDGAKPAKGGMAEQLTSSRRLYSNITGDINVNLNQTNNRLHENTSGITAAMLTAANATERNELLRWARGVDVDDEDNDGPTTDNRTSMGDPLHTQPRAITYFADPATSTVDKTVFLTTNDGFLHAVNADNGATEFGFIPEDLLPNLKIYRDNVAGTGAIKIYGLDGHMTIWDNDVNGDGDVLQANNGTADTGEHLYLYLAMRRGGNDIYALNVTDRNNPELKWILRGDLDNNHQVDSGLLNPDFAELGQSWSASQLARVLWNGAERQVLLFGGGYDVDMDNATILAGSDIGRGVFMVDAETGAQLWMAAPGGFADLRLSTLNHSIAADLTLVDFDQDGLTDYFFAADIGGQLFRFDINRNNSGATNFASGGVIASISGRPSSGGTNARRFFEAPSVALGADSQHLNIAIGSGTRTDPLGTTVNNRMYVFRDRPPRGAPTSHNYAGEGVINESGMYDATDNLIQQGSAAQRQAALTRLGASNNHGWFIELETSGEKILGRTNIFNGVLLFNSFIPVSSMGANCVPQPGENYFYALNIESASSVFNLNTADSSVSLNKLDRRQLLNNGSIAPTPSILSTSDKGSEICIGTECFQNRLQGLGSIPIHLNFWRENQ